MMFGFTSRARKEIAANIAALEQVVADYEADFLRQEAELDMLSDENAKLHARLAKYIGPRERDAAGRWLPTSVAQVLA